jgi:hypothetical protein
LLCEQFKQNRGCPYFAIETLTKGVVGAPFLKMNKKVHFHLSSNFPVKLVQPNNHPGEKLKIPSSSHLTITLPIELTSQQRL